MKRNSFRLRSPRLRPGRLAPNRGSRRDDPRILHCESLEPKLTLNAPQLMEVSPAPNAVDAVESAPIVLTFDEAIAPSSVADGAAIVLNSNLRGRLVAAGNDIAVAGNTVTITLAQHLLPGERVDVSVTTAVMNETGESLVAPFTWSFQAAARAGTARFRETEQTFAPSLGYSYVALGDFDGDRDLDGFLVGSGTDSGAWLNRGDGTFTRGSSATQYSLANGVEAGDFDGDGDLDVFISQAQFEPAAMLLNDGAGNFATSSQTFGRGFQEGILVGDVDGDGDLDLYQGMSSAPDQLWLNNGAGQFAQSPQLFGDDHYMQPAWVDWDRDGDLDLLALGYDTALWRNVGAGNFTREAFPSLTAAILHASLGDLDGDGDVDLFGVTYNGDSPTNHVVFLNNNGAFVDSGQRLDGVRDREAELADVDGDGDLDAYISSEEANVLWLNDGTGSFTDSGQRRLDGHTESAAFGDFDGDGDLDLWVANGSGEIPSRIWLNEPPPLITVAVTDHRAEVFAGTTLTYDVLVENHMDAAIHAADFKTALSLSATGSSWTSIASPGSTSTPSGVGLPTDVISLAPRGWVRYMVSVPTENSLIDRAAAKLTLRAVVHVEAGVLGPEAVEARAIDANLFHYAASIGSGVFYQYGDVLGVGPAHDVALGDLDNDGDLDLWIDYHDVKPDEAWFNDGHGNFADSGQRFGRADGGGTELADLDGDGDLDAFVVTRSNDSDEVWLNDGRGYFARIAQQLESDYGVDAALGDFDGDGDIDSFVVNTFHPNEDVLWLNDGSANFTRSSQVFRQLDASDIASGDLDSDGDLDLWITNRPGQNEVWLNDGTGVFHDSGRIYGGFAGGTSGVALGDMDGDGDLDAYLINQSDGQINGADAIWWNDGLGHFASSTQRIETPVGRRAGVGDLDGDGDLDIAATNGEWRYNRGQFVFMNDGAGRLTERLMNNLGGEASSIAFGDLDGDGDLDAVLGNLAFNGIDAGGVQVMLNGNNELAMSLSDGVLQLSDGEMVTYTLVVENRGRDAIAGAHVTFEIATHLVDAQWHAAFSTGASGVVQGAGNIDESVNLEPGATIQYVIQARLEDTGFLTDVAVRARLDMPDGEFDIHAEDNELQDVNMVITRPTQGSGVYSSSRQMLGEGGATTVDAGDLDGDGDLDVILAGRPETPPQIWLNGGHGVFTAGATLDYPYQVADLELVDVDQDQDLDIVIGNDSPSNGSYQFFNDGAGTFTLHAGSVTSQSASDVAFGDLDADGDPDGWAGGGASNILRNIGDGILVGNSLAPQSVFSVMDVADLDGDGDLDTFFGGASVWFNDGRASVDLVNPFYGPPTRKVRLADLDLDGDLDAVSAEFYGQQVDVMLNDGRGRFRGGGRLINLPVSDLDLGDADGDGDVDVLLTRPGQTQSLRLYLNDGHGRFAPSAFGFGRSEDTQAAAFGDFDGDGDLDVYRANAGPDNVWFNTDRLSDVSVTIDDGPAAVAGQIVEFDVVIANAGPDETRNVAVAARFPDVLRNLTWTSILSPGASAAPSGSGMLEELVDIPSGGSVRFRVQAILERSALATFTVDAAIEVASDTRDAVDENDAVTRIWTITVSETTAQAGVFVDSGQRLGGEETIATLLGDLDGDFDRDAVTVGTGSNATRIWRNTGSGVFEALPQRIGAADTWGGVLANVDGDTDLDLVLVGYNGATAVWLNDGAGGFIQSAWAIAPGLHRSIAAADLDADGDVDLLLGQVNQQPNLVVFNDGLGRFDLDVFELGVSITTSVALGDVDGDGDLDAWFGRSVGMADQLWLNDGDGGFTDSGQRFGDFGTRAVKLGDLDSDGDLDAMLIGLDASAVWINDGHGLFQKTAQTLEVANSFDVAFGDLDGDRDLDAYLANAFFNAQQPDAIWWNLGNATFVRGGQEIENGTSLSAALGDLDGDGDLDAFVGTGNSEFGLGQPDRVWFNQPWPGDTFPFDAKIDIDDLNRVRNHFGMDSVNGGVAEGDVYPYDGRVDLYDLNAVRNRFGAEALNASPIATPRAAETPGAQPARTPRRAAGDYLFGMLAEQSKGSELSYHDGRVKRTRR